MPAKGVGGKESSHVASVVIPVVLLSLVAAMSRKLASNFPPLLLCRNAETGVLAKSPKIEPVAE